VKALDALNTQQFELALYYWMNQFNFPYTAYDESIYPNEQRKPTGSQYKKTRLSNNVPKHLDQALLFACQTLIEYPTSLVKVLKTSRQRNPYGNNVFFNEPFMELIRNIKKVLPIK
jgi:hypothetical protein